MRKLSVVVWFFVFATSLLAAGVAIVGLHSALPRPPGPDAPLAGIALVFLFGILAVCAVVFGVCLRFRPARESFTPGAWVTSVLAYAAVLGGLWILSHTVGRYALTLRVVDPSGQPISRAAIRYYSFPLGQGIGRFDRLAEGNTHTDSSGAVTIVSNHAHRVDVDIRKSGFKTAHLQLEAAGRRYPHQLYESNVKVEMAGSAVVEKNGSLIPATGDISLVLVLEHD